MQLIDRLNQSRAVKLPGSIAGYAPTAGLFLTQVAAFGFEGLAIAIFGSRLAMAPIGYDRWNWAAVVAVGYVIVAVLQQGFVKPGRDAGTGVAVRSLVGVFACFCLVDLGRIVHWQWDTSLLVLWFGASTASVVAVRTIAMDLSNRFPVLVPAASPAVLVGSGPQAVALLTHLREAPDARHRLIGFFDDRAARLGPLSGSLPYLGDIRSLIDSVSTLRVRNVYVAIPWSDGERIAELLEKLRYLPMTVRLLPDQTPPALPTKIPHSLDGIVMPTLMRPPFSLLDRVGKRFFDFAVATLLLLLMLPLFLVVAALIRLDSPGGVFFRQTRTGRFGVSFKIYKFRSLHVAQADSKAETLVSRGDARVTRVGRYLRKYSIDELPQILNVMFGHMSLVGPRPHAPRAKADGRIYTDVMPDYPLRYRVRPGMTGWAQVNGWRGNTDTVEKLYRRVEYDFQYIENWSMRRDLYILLRTIPSVVAPPPDNA